MSIVIKIINMEIIWINLSANTAKILNLAIIKKAPTKKIFKKI